MKDFTKQTPSPRWRSFLSLWILFVLVKAVFLACVLLSLLSQPYPLISVRDIPVDVSATQRPIEVAFDVREPSVGGHLIPVPRSCCGGEFAFQRGVKKEIQVLVVQPESLAPIIPNR